MSEEHKPTDSFEDAERYKRLFVDPAVEALGAKMESHLKPITDAIAEQKATNSKQDERLENLEASQGKALIGYGIFATGISVVLAGSWDWIKTHVLGR